MDQLFVETESGRMPISHHIVEKYHIKKGTHSPFTHNRIVNQYGDFTLVRKPKIMMETPKENTQMFSTAESIDIAHGVDSTID